jgi:hypothetical protein
MKCRTFLRTVEMCEESVELGHAGELLITSQATRGRSSLKRASALG